MNPFRIIKAKVELYNGSALVATYTYNDAIKSITIERVGENSKFFGFGVFQKANIKLRDINREINITTDNSFKIYFSEGNGENFIKAVPTFYVTETNRDENTNELSITAYDALNAATASISEIELDDTTTIAGYVNGCAAHLGTRAVIPTSTFGDLFNLAYDTGANFDGAETVREVLGAAAEATLTIFFINSNDEIQYKPLLKDGEAYAITKDDYFKLDSKTNRRLQAIVNATQLGDNVGASIDAIGTTQYIRDNPFLELREDIDDVVENAVNIMGGITINQFDLDWRGDFLVEPGDRLQLTTKDNNYVYSYLLNDVIEYNGAYKQKTKWSYETNEDKEDASNPSTLGETLKQTFAKVDKANKQVDIVVSEVSANQDTLSAIAINVDGISNSVKALEDNVNSSVEDVNNEVANLYSEVATKISKDDFSIMVQDVVNENGVDKVITSTGFTFDADGLTVNKANSEMETTITEDGMIIKKDNDDVLEVNNTGVFARNLHANTYLIIGKTSRFEDYDNHSRTGCFWVGGAD